MDVRRLLSLIPLFGSLFIIARCEVFSAIAHVREAVTMAKVNNSDLKELLQGYINEQLARMERAERFIQELHDLSGDEIKDPTFKITHPFNAYRFIRNHSDIFNATLEKAVTEITSFENDTVAFYEANIRKLLESQVSIADLNGTAAAFNRLQTTYNITTREFANGLYIGESESKLTADECRDVAAILCLMEIPAVGIDWMKEAILQKLDERGDGATIDGVKRVVANSAFEGENPFAAVRAINYKSQAKHGDRRTRILARRIAADHKDFKQMAHPKDVERSRLHAKTIDKGDPDINRLCSGQARENNKTEREKLLTCRYDNNCGHPYLILQPVKYEQLSAKPYVVVYHDVFSEHDIRTMKGFAKNKLKRSTTGDGRRRGFNNVGRISASAPIRTSNHTKKLVDKVKAITSLQAGSEVLQITNYGVGGYYKPHYDAFENLENNRIATFMVYLSDVDMGGATIFPRIELSIFPKKGTAVFWENTYRNVTQMDFRLRHSACPVLKGDKWVGTFWIRQVGNEFNLPCTLNEED